MENNRYASSVRIPPTAAPPAWYVAAAAGRSVGHTSHLSSRLPPDAAAESAGPAATADWRARLAAVIQHTDQVAVQHETILAGHAAQVESFLAAVVDPAFAEIKRELEQRARSVTVVASRVYGRSLLVRAADREECIFSVEATVSLEGAFVLISAAHGNVTTLTSDDSTSARPLAEVSKECIIERFVHEYTNIRGLLTARA
jgi:hypothetical protein